MTIWGAILPLSRLLPWLVDHGLDLPLLSSELLSIRIGGFVGLDVMLSVIPLLTFFRHQSRLLVIRHWWLPVVATCHAGMSCGLPWFLYLQEPRSARGG